MGKDIETGTCFNCKSEGQILRKYYYYLIPCDCCNSKNDNHFEIVKHCITCKPKPPVRISLIIDPIL